MLNFIQRKNMTIKTKFNVGDYVWFVYEGKVKHWQVRKIEVIVKDAPCVRYELKPPMGSFLYGPYDESQLYPTEEKLYKKNKSLVR